MLAMYVMLCVVDWDEKDDLDNLEGMGHSAFDIVPNR